VILKASLILKASSRSRPQALAGAIAARLRESGTAQVQAVGAGAVNQAIKAAALARQYVRSEGIELVLVPLLREIELDGFQRTAVVLEIKHSGDHERVLHP
jgi:stage V sporulation protein S